MDAVCQRRDVLDTPDPLPDIKRHGLRPEADLNGAVRQGIVMEVALRVPLDADGRGGFQCLPIRGRHVGLRMTGAAMCQRPGEPVTADVDRKDARLPGILGAPAGAVHHPQEGWLDPRHPRHGERRRDERALRERGIGDLVAIGLIDADGVGVVDGADLALGYLWGRGFHAAG